MRPVANQGGHPFDSDRAHTVHGGRSAEVVAPAFHARGRSFESSRPPQFPSPLDDHGARRAAVDAPAYGAGGRQFESGRAPYFTDDDSGPAQRLTRSASDPGGHPFESARAPSPPDTTIHGRRSAEVVAPACQAGGRRFESGRLPSLDPEGRSAEVVASFPTARDQERRFESGRPSPSDVAHCLATLEALRDTAPDDPARVAVERAAAHLTKTAKQKRRLARKQENRRVDREASASSARAAAYFTPALPAPGSSVRELRNQRHCYVCKLPFRRLHAFYHALCASCADRNFAARTLTADLTGRRAIVTGGRIKIGYEIAGSLLRAGARVTVTTRFPRDAEQRYADLPQELRERLTIEGLDFLDLRGVSAWIDREVARGEPLDILISNAAQTVRRPPAYYARLAAAEAAPPLEGRSTELAEEAIALLFPDRVDAEGKPVDLRHRNSWVLNAAEIEPAEVAEVHVVNAIVPFLIASRLRALMTRSTFADRYIVNVSAMEGVFAYHNKQPRHPHTNMAKAALNMFTRTSAPEFLTDGIYMNSVDTGWITQENPHPMEERLKSRGFCPPLDIVDGAARVLAPVYRGVLGDRIAGGFFKDYELAPW